MENIAKDYANEKEICRSLKLLLYRIRECKESELFQYGKASDNVELIEKELERLEENHGNILYNKANEYSHDLFLNGLTEESTIESSNSRGRR